MRFFRAVCALLTLSAMAAAAQPTEPLGMVMMNKDLNIPDPAPAGFPALAEKQVLPCLAIVTDGFLVVSPDLNGKPCAAFLQRRDEWGRSTADTWIHDSTLKTNTLIITVPVPLKPGHLPLQRGASHPVVAQDDKTWTLNYDFGGLSRQCTVARADADFVPPPKPETDPFKIKVLKLEALLKDSRDQEAELVASLDRSRSNATHVATLLRNLALSQTEVTRLRTELVETDRMCKDLAGHTPALKAVPALQQELKALVQEQIQLSTQMEKTRMESEPLLNIQKAVVALQETMQGLKTSASARQAELKGLLKTCAGEDIREDKDTLLSLFDKADTQRTRMNAEVQHLEAAKGILTTLHDQTARLAQENQDLLAKLQTVKTELQELRKKIQELQQPPQAKPSAVPSAAEPEK